MRSRRWTPPSPVVAHVYDGSPEARARLSRDLDRFAADTRALEERAAASETALLLSIARNLAERASCYRGHLADGRHAPAELSRIADELRDLANRLGADPFAIGEGEEVRHG